MSRSVVESSLFGFNDELRRSGLEESVLVDYVKQRSIEDLRNHTKSKFGDMAVRTTTKPNNGIVFIVDQYYHNKCFFISFCDAMKVYGYQINAAIMAIIYNMRNDELVDTDKHAHKTFITSLAEKYNAKIEIYFGQCINDVWYTTPDTLAVIGTGQHVVRILNKGVHFEYLTNIDGGFFKDLSKSPIIQKVKEHQDKKKKREEEASLKLAIELQEEEKRLAREEQRRARECEEIQRQVRAREEELRRARALEEERYRARALEEEQRRAKLREEEEERKRLIESDYIFALKLAEDMTINF